EVRVAPLRRLVGPCALEAAGDRVRAFTAAEGAPPPDALVFHGAALGFEADQVGITGTVALSEGVAADDERNRLLVVHRHSTEGLADVVGGSQRIRIAAGTLRVHVDQTHLHGAERTREVPWCAVA